MMIAISVMKVFLISDLLGFSDIKKIKEKHVWSSQIMNALVQEILKYEYCADGTNPAPDTVSNDERVEVFSMKNDELENIVSSYNAKNGNKDQQNQLGKVYDGFSC